MRKAIAVFLIMSAIGLAGQIEYTQPKPKQVLKVSRLGTRDVAIICLDQSDPTGRKAGDVLIISCKKESAK